MANLSYDCSGGNHSHCVGDFWDLTSVHPIPCECECHRTVLPEEQWPDQEYRANLRATFEAMKVAQENAQAEQDSLDD